MSGFFCCADLFFIFVAVLTKEEQKNHEKKECTKEKHRNHRNGHGGTAGALTALATHIDVTFGTHEAQWSRVPEKGRSSERERERESKRVKEELAKIFLKKILTE